MPRRFLHGFTLTELVMVIVIVGILAVAAMPRFFDRQTFEARGFHEQVKAMARYAQKVAIAQHRPVFVNVTANAVCLTYVADGACTNVTAGEFVLNPAGGQRFRSEAPAGVVLASSSASFSFSALGRPSAGAVTIVVTGDGIARNVIVEQETGYVH